MRKQTDAAEIASLRARLTTAETERDEAIQDRHEAERLLETAWVQRGDETEKAKRAEARVEAAEQERDQAHKALDEWRETFKALGDSLAAAEKVCEAMRRYFDPHTDWDGEMQALEDARAALACPPPEEKCTCDAKRQNRGHKFSCPLAACPPPEEEK